MKFTKILLTGAVAMTAAMFTTACGLFEDSTEEGVNQFYDPNNANGAGSMGKDGLTDPNFGKGNGPDFGNAGENGGPGSFVDDPMKAAAYADGVGARIAGVNFQPVYFLFDQNNVPSSEESKVQVVAEYLMNHAEAGVVIEGNCDERGTAEYNRALGERRAISARDFLVELGIAPDRIKTISYGEDRPAAMGNDENAWMQNRRADFIPVYLLKK